MRWAMQADKPLLIILWRVQPVRWLGGWVVFHDGINIHHDGIQSQVRLGDWTFAEDDVSMRREQEMDQVDYLPNRV